MFIMKEKNMKVEKEKCMDEERCNIVLAGLIYDQNLGDQVIYKCCRNMIEKTLINTNYELRNIDLYGRVRMNNNSLTDLTYKVISKIKRKLKNQKNVEEEILENVNKSCKVNIDRKTKALIFVGGGLIKFNHQFLAKSIEKIVEYANLHDIPVMFSAVGVEGYDENSQECLSLKEKINLPCVKMITTRDDILLLREKWIIHNRIESGLVGDPACVISNYFKIEKINTGRKRIGLGVSRGNLFEDYGGLLNEDKLIQLWIGVYKKLENNGFDCYIFTNGLDADQNFAIKLIKILGKKYESKLLHKPNTIEELCTNIANFDGMIVTRLHASIIGYSYNIPFVSLVWNNKQTMFGKVIEKSEWFIKEDKMTVENIYEKFLNVYGKKNNFINKKSFSISTYTYLNKFIHDYVM